MNTYDRVMALLVQYPDARSNDKLLLWYFWDREGKVGDGSVFNRTSRITLEDFLTSTSAETIVRARRKVQEVHADLRADEVVQSARKAIEKTKGTFIFKH